MCFALTHASRRDAMHAGTDYLHAQFLKYSCMRVRILFLSSFPSLGNHSISILDNNIQIFAFFMSYVYNNLMLYRNTANVTT